MFGTPWASLELRATGTVDEVIRRTEDKFQFHNRTRVDFTSGEREKRVHTFPAAALQQILRNALMVDPAHVAVSLRRAP